MTITTKNTSTPSDSSPSISPASSRSSSPAPAPSRSRSRSNSTSSSGSLSNLPTHAQPLEQRNRPRLETAFSKLSVSTNSSLSPPPNSPPASNEGEADHLYFGATDCQELSAEAAQSLERAFSGSYSVVRQGKRKKEESSESENNSDSSSDKDKFEGLEEAIADSRRHFFGNVNNSGSTAASTATATSTTQPIRTVVPEQTTHKSSEMRQARWLQEKDKESTRNIGVAKYVFVNPENMERTVLYIAARSAGMYSTVEVPVKKDDQGNSIKACTHSERLLILTHLCGNITIAEKDGTEELIDLKQFTRERIVSTNEPCGTDNKQKNCAGLLLTAGPNENKDVESKLWPEFKYVVPYQDKDTADPDKFKKDNKQHVKDKIKVPGYKSDTESENEGKGKDGYTTRIIHSVVEGHFFVEHRKEDFTKLPTVPAVHLKNYDKNNDKTPTSNNPGTKPDPKKLKQQD